MKHTLTFLTALLVALTLNAQKTPFEKYELAPEAFEHIFLDHVAHNASTLISSGENQYFGQVDRDGKFYGYGRYVMGDGTQIFGKFRNGELIFGIRLGKTSAIVGNAAFNCSYGLSTGRLEYVFHSNTRQLLDTQALSDYAFQRIIYANGDEYVGETYQGLRHGFGLYYYSNGDIWFGQYDRDIRNGFGATFSVDNHLNIGQWQAEDARREIYVKARK